MEHYPFDTIEYMEFISKSAGNALTKEVLATPKPGLVDRSNNGSHPDMDLDLFLASARVLVPHFRMFTQVALEMDNDLLLPSLRGYGLLAEKSMYEVTGGVNTHKGIIFSMGLLSACLLRLSLKLGRRPLMNDIPELLTLIRFNTFGISGELKEPGEHSNGRSVFQTLGIRGIRQEAEDGFPGVFQTGLPALVHWREQWGDSDLTYCLCLLELILVTDDTNVLSRGGLSGLAFMRENSRMILDKAVRSSKGALLFLLKRFDEEAIRRNLSPGGAADGLALCLFLDEVLSGAPSPHSG